MPGRINAKTASAALGASNVAIGAGWGGTATVAFASGSNDQRGQVAVTASATTPAAATATVTITFAQAFGDTPFAIVTEVDNTEDAAVNVTPTDVVGTTTSLVFRRGTIPVATKVYTYNYIVIG